jgi:hypothetical protein
MKRAIVVALFGLAALGLVASGLLGCEEEKKLAYVEGHFEFLDVDFNPKGSLAQGGAKYYGRCSFSSDSNKFLFEVGNDKLNAIDSATETYLKFTGIVGPPQAGVYTDPVAKVEKEGVEFHTVFGSAIIANGGNEFSFDQPTEIDDCYVALFAQAAEGELTSIDEVEFTYYVGLQCPNLDDVASGSTNLNGFNGWFFFQGC